MLSPEFNALPDRTKRELYALLPDVGYLALGWGMVTAEKCVKGIRTAIEEGRRIVAEEGIESRTVEKDGEEERVGFQSWALRAKARDNHARMEFWTSAMEAPAIPLFALLTTVFHREAPEGTLIQAAVEDFLLPPRPEDFDLTTELPVRSSPEEGWAGRAADEFFGALLASTDGGDPAAEYRRLRAGFVEQSQRPLASIFRDRDEWTGDFLPSSLEGLDIGPGIEWRAALYINAHDFVQGKFYSHWPTPIEENVALLGDLYDETPEDRVRGIAERLTGRDNPNRLNYRVQRYRPDGPNIPVSLRKALAEETGMSSTQAVEYLKRSGFELPRDLLFTLKKR